MNVILSKKGFDSSYGQHPSIILPKENGYKMISFPIPETNSKREGVAAEDLDYYLDDKTYNLNELFEQLEITDKIKYEDNGTKVFKDNKFHFDPEIFKTSKTRKDKNKKYYATLGQSGTAAKTLNPIKKDDIFLFFGTFQRTILEIDKIKYDTLMEPIHALWGYMFVDDIVHISPNDTCIKSEYLEKYPNLEEHLHFINRKEEGDNNIIICGKRFGTFNYSESYSDIHRLTKLGYKRSVWNLPPFLLNAQMGYQVHADNQQIKDPTRVLINGYGQELIIKDSTFDIKEMETWLKKLGVPL